MERAFSDPYLWSQYVGELQEWEGTPYGILQKVKKRGADCTTFFLESLIATGTLEKFDYPKYRSKVWYLNEEEKNFIVDHLILNFKKYTKQGYIWKYYKKEGAEFNRGDILLFKVKPKIDAFVHCAVCVGKDTMIHCSEGLAVRREKIGKWRKYCKGMFILYKK